MAQHYAHTITSNATTAIILHNNALARLKPLPVAYGRDSESACKATFDLLTSKQIMRSLHHHDVKTMQASKAKVYMGICMCKPHLTTRLANSPSTIDFNSNPDMPGASASAILGSVKIRVQRLHVMIQSDH